MHRFLLSISLGSVIAFDIEVFGFMSNMLCNLDQLEFALMQIEGYRTKNNHSFIIQTESEILLLPALVSELVIALSSGRNAT